jgi:hypothetical protein
LGRRLDDRGFPARELLSYFRDATLQDLVATFAFCEAWLPDFEGRAGRIKRRLTGSAHPHFARESGAAFLFPRQINGNDYFPLPGTRIKSPRPHFEQTPRG